MSPIPSLLANLPPNTPNVPVNAPLTVDIATCAGVKYPDGFCSRICSAVEPALTAPSPAAPARIAL